MGKKHNIKFPNIIIHIQRNFIQHFFFFLYIIHQLLKYKQRIDLYITEKKI